MASWKDSARSVGASSGASVHLSSEYDMARFLSMLPEEDDDEEFPGEHAGSPAAGRMVVPPIAAIPFVTESKSLAYELYWMLESSLVENCSVVMDDEDDRMSVGTPLHSPLSMCCFEGDDAAAPSSLIGTRTSPTRMLLLVIVAFALLVFWLVGVRFFVDGWQSSRTSLAPMLALKILFQILPTQTWEFLYGVSRVEKALLSLPLFCLSVVREEKNETLDARRESILVLTRATTKRLRLRDDESN